MIGDKKYKVVKKTLELPVNLSKKYLVSEAPKIVKEYPEVVRITPED